MQINSIFYKIITAIAIVICTSVIYSGQAIAAENASKTVTASATISKPFENTAFVKATIETSASQAAKESFIEASTKNINNIADLLISIGKLFGSFLILIVLFLILIYFGYILIKDIKKNTIIIEPFEMPDELTKEGYTGKSIAHQLSDKFNHIQKNARVLPNIFVSNQQEKLQGEINLPWRQEHIEISVSNFSIKSLRFLFYPLKRWLGYKVIYICGEVQQISDNEYKVISRCDNIDYTTEKATKENLQQSLLPIAESLYERIHPEILTSYLLNRDGDKDKAKAEKIINVMLSNQSNKTNYKNGLLLSAYILQEKEKYTDAIITLDKFQNIKLSKEEKITRYTIKSDCFYSQNKYEQAINELKKRIKIENNNVWKWSYFNWGIALKKLGKNKEAGEKFKKAIELNPNFGDAYNNWGVVLKELGEYEEATEKYKKAIELNPNNAHAYTNWGIVLTELGKYEEAIEKIQRATEINPNLIETYNNWGAVLVTLGQHKEAIEKFQKAIELNPNNADTYYNWGVMLLQLSKYSEAVEKFQKAIEINSSYVAAYLNWGYALGKIEQYREAIEKFQKVIELNTDEALSKQAKQVIKNIEELLKKKK